MEKSIGYMLGNFKGKVKSVVHVEYRIVRLDDFAPIKTIAPFPPPCQEIFNEKGKVEESVAFDKDLKIKKRTQFVYNAQSQLIEQQHYNEYNELVNSFAFDENENTINTDNDDKFDLENSSGSFAVRMSDVNFKEVLDEDQRVIERYNMNDSVKVLEVSKETYKYDSHGNITERCTYSGPSNRLSGVEKWHYQYYDDINVEEDSESEIDNDDLAF